MRQLEENQKFIKAILNENGLKPAWLKKKLPHIDIYYLLSDKCKRFDTDSLEEIKTEFRKAGYITSENERTEKYLRQIMRMTGIVENSLGFISEKSLEFAESEEVIDFGEKVKLNEFFVKLEKTLVAEIHNSKKVLGL